MTHVVLWVQVCTTVCAIWKTANKAQINVHNNMNHACRRHLLAGHQYQVGNLLHSAESFANLKSVDCCLSQLSRHIYGRQGTYEVYPQHIKQYKLLTDLCYLDKPVTPFAWSPWVTQVLQQRLRSKLARLLNPPLLDLYVSLVACPKIWTCNTAVLFAVHCNEP